MRGWHTEGNSTLRGHTHEKQYLVDLTNEERNHLIRLLKGGTRKVRKIKRTQVLLKADDGWTDQQIAGAFYVGRATVERTRKRYAEGEAALHDKKRNRVYERKMDGEVEARLIALVNSAPPQGYQRWTLRLLAEHLVRLEEVPFDRISHETIRLTLKKNALKPWQRKEWVIPPEAKRRVHLRHGTYPGPLSAAIQPAGACGLPGRNQQAFACRDPGALANGARQAGTIRFRICALRHGEPFHALRAFGQLASCGSDRPTGESGFRFLLGMESARFCQRHPTGIQRIALSTEPFKSIP